VALEDRLHEREAQSGLALVTRVEERPPLDGVRTGVL
jgi:hypothetical protein